MSGFILIFGLNMGTSSKTVRNRPDTPKAGIARVSLKYARISGNLSSGLGVFASADVLYVVHKFSSEQRV